MAISKRQYLSDLKPVSDVYSVKNLTLHFSKSALLTFTLALNEYNQYLDECIRKEAKKPKLLTFKNEDEDETEEFNWDPFLAKYQNIFIMNLVRSVGGAGLRKTFELTSRQFFDIKTVDRLTKDVSKSLIRKVSKYSRRVASEKLFKTGLWATSFTYLAIMSCDILQNMYSWARGQLKVTPIGVVKYLLKESLYISTVWISYSTGYAAGGYFDVNYGPIIGATIFEVVGANFIQSLLEFKPY